MAEQEFKIDVNYLDQLHDMIASIGSDDFEDDLLNLEHFIYRMKNDFREKVVGRSVMSAYRDNIQFYNLYKKYYIYVRKLLRNGLIFYEHVDPRYKEMEISDRDCMEIARDFFYSQSEFFKHGFNEFACDNVEDHLLFIDPNPNTDGEMHYIECVDEAFVVIPNHRNMTKATILIHELEHVIDTYSNPKFFKNRIIRECASMFMELISTDYVGGVLNIKDDPEVRRFSIHSIVKMDARYIFYKNQLLYIGDKYKELNSKGLNKIAKYYGYTGYDIFKFNESCLINDYYYQISYLIAIELYNIYEKDKEKALCILEYIIMHGNDDNILDILSKLNITLTEGIIPYEESLCKKLEI